MRLAAWVHLNKLLEKTSDLEKEFARTYAMGLRVLLIYLQSPDEQIDELSVAAQNQGLETHFWVKPVFGAKDLVVRKMLDPQKQNERFGFPRTGACLNNPSNLESGYKNIQAFLKQNAGKMDGIHLDYVRNDNAVFLMSAPCHCEVCRAARMKWLGRENLTDDDLQNPSIMYKELKFRNDSITRFVEKLRALTKEHRMQLSISARAGYLAPAAETEEKPFGLGPAVYEGQDWLDWSERGLLDFICTMNYHTACDDFTAVLDDHLRLLKDAPVVFYSGLGVKSSMGELTPKQTAYHLSLLRDRGVKGVSIFHYDALTDEYASVLKSFSE